MTTKFREVVVTSLLLDSVVVIFCVNVWLPKTTQNSTFLASLPWKYSWEEERDIKMKRGRKCRINRGEKKIKGRKV